MAVIVLTVANSGLIDMERDTIMLYGKRRTVQRINKRRAKREYEAGKEIYLMPSKCALVNPWVSPCPIRKESEQWLGDTFDNRIRDYQCYNCNYEVGYYPHYYVEVN